MKLTKVKRFEVLSERRCNVLKFKEKSEEVLAAYTRSARSFKGHCHCALIN